MRYSSGPYSFSSLRVPLWEMSMAGNIRRSNRSRSITISVLPVPLNSWKMTSSMREPVSTRAVPMTVSDPPPSAIRAAPKNRLGFSMVLASIPPLSTRPEPRCSEL